MRSSFRHSSVRGTSFEVMGSTARVSLAHVTGSITASLLRHDIEPKNGVTLTAGIIIADVVGAGILSMPVAVAKLGWLLGAIAIVVLLSMNVHISMLVWRTRMGCPRANTYTRLAWFAFAKAPPQQQNLAVSLTAGTQYVFIFLTLGLYALSVGRSLGMLLYDVHICLPWFTVIGLAILLPAHLTARTMGKWSGLIVLNVLTIIGSIFIPLITMASQGVEAMRLPDSKVHAIADLTPSSLLEGLNVMTFAFTSQFMLVEIMAEMENPADLPKAYLLSSPFQGGAFLICGLLGYYYMGDRVSGVIGDNISFGIPFQLAAVCLFTHMIITYLIKGIVLCRAIHLKLSEDTVDDDSRRGWSIWTGIVMVVFVATWVISQAFPFFTNLVDLLGASITPISCYIIPIVMYIRWLHDAGPTARKVSTVEWVVIGAELVLALVLIVAGTYFAIQDLIEQWNTFGAPFACHCENIWRTCECSADHAGMSCAAPHNATLNHLEF